MHKIGRDDLGLTPADHVEYAGPEAGFTRLSVERMRYAGDGTERVIESDTFMVERAEDAAAVALAVKALRAWRPADIVEIDEALDEAAIDERNRFRARILTAEHEIRELIGERDRMRQQVERVKIMHSNDLAQVARERDEIKAERGDIARDRERLRQAHVLALAANDRLQLELREARLLGMGGKRGAEQNAQLIEQLEECQRVVMQRDHEIRDLKAELNSRSQLVEPMHPRAAEAEDAVRRFNEQWPVGVLVRFYPANGFPAPVVTGKTDAPATVAYAGTEDAFAHVTIEGHEGKRYGLARTKVVSMSERILLEALPKIELPVVEGSEES